MEVALACKICIAKHGINGADVASLPGTYEELYDHIERVHHIAVCRDGETPEEAVLRFHAAVPEAWPNTNCPCDACRACYHHALAMNAIHN